MPAESTNTTKCGEKLEIGAVMAYNKLKYALYLFQREQQQEGFTMLKKKTPPGRSRGDELRDYVLLAMFATIILLLTFTPIGFINLVVIKATIIQVPVIIGSVLLGPKKGAALGAIFGLASFISNTTVPTLLSFCFSPLIPVPGMGRGSLWALFICFIPRVLVGIVPWYAYKLIRLPIRRETKKTRTVELAATGVIGALTNTVLVMGMIYFVFRGAYAQAKAVPVEAVLGLIMGVVGTNGLAEAAASAVIVMAVCYPLQHMMGQEALKGALPVMERPGKPDKPAAPDKPENPIEPEDIGGEE